MKRVLTAAALIPPVAYVVFWGPQWLFLAVLATVALLSYYEYAGIAAHFGAGALHPVAYAGGLALLLIPAEPWLALVLLALVALGVSMRAESLAAALPGAALLVIGVAYIFGSWRCAAFLREVSPYWLFYALAVTWVGDIGAYYAGRRFGRHKLAPRVSPGKSWEGAVASVVAAAVFGIVFLNRLIPATPLAHAVTLSVIANAAGQVGDLAESAMKRGAGVKDSGTILPGHGGFLDRVDSTLFVLPVVYIYLKLA